MLIWILVCKGIMVSKKNDFKAMNNFILTSQYDDEVRLCIPLKCKSDDMCAFGFCKGKMVAKKN